MAGAVKAGLVAVAVPPEPDTATAPSSVPPVVQAVEVVKGPHT